MSARLRILTLLLLVGTFVARGQDLRTGVATADGGFLAAGEYLAWLDADGNVLRTRPLDRTLTALVESGGRWYALDTDGLELLELDEKGQVQRQEQLPAQGRLRGLAADGSVLWAVTDAGEILRGGASGWTTFDFNAQYDGYYPRMAFWAVAAGGGSVMVAGTSPGGTPAAFTSARGTVWSERLLDYTEGGSTFAFTALPTSLSYDAVQDRFYLLGGDEELALPGCSHCNSLTRYPVRTLYARIPAGFGALLLGSDGFIRKMDR